MAGRLLLIIALLSSVTWAQPTTRLKPSIVSALKQYVKQVEEGMSQQHSQKIRFLWLEDNPKLREQTLRGRISVSQLKADVNIKGCLIHDWIVGMFSPDGGIGQVLAVLQDYDKYAQMYPEVIQGKLVSKQADDFELYQRLLKKKVFAVDP